MRIHRTRTVLRAYLYFLLANKDEKTECVNNCTNALRYQAVGPGYGLRAEHITRKYSQ